MPLNCSDVVRNVKQNAGVDAFRELGLDKRQNLHEPLNRFGSSFCRPCLIRFQRGLDSRFPATEALCAQEPEPMGAKPVTSYSKRPIVYFKCHAPQLQ